MSAGPLSAEPSFAFHCQPHQASASSSPLPPSRLQQDAQQHTSALHSGHTPPDTSASCDAEAALHEPHTSFLPGQQAPAVRDHAVLSRQTAEPSGHQRGLNQPNPRQGAFDPGHWGPLPPLAEEAAGCHGAAGLDSSAYTPQELADHLDKLKKEFRQICSTLLDGDAQAICPQDPAVVLVRLHVSLGGRTIVVWVL